MFGVGAPFGSTPFGLGPQVFATPYVPADLPGAVQLDPLTRDAPLDSDGHYGAMGTIEQAVVISFTIPRGSLRHSPTTGHDFLTLPRLSRVKLDAEIDRRAAQASPFDQLIAAGLVELVRVVKNHPKATETGLLIEWRRMGTARVEETPVGT